MTASHYHSATSTTCAGERRGKPPAIHLPLSSHLLLGTIILIFAATLRISQLEPSSLWFDDAWVALVARIPASQISHIGMTTFGFDAILWSWFQLVGFSEISAKLIPFVAGCLGPLAVYAMAIRKGVGWIPGVIAASILVVAPMNVQYAATVKQYTSEALLTVLVIWLAWAVLEKPRRNNIVWLGIAACLSVLVSGMMVFVVLPALCIPAAWTAFKQRELRFDCLLVVALALAFIAVWIPLMSADAMNPALRLYWSKFYVIRTNGINGIAVSSLALAEHFVYGLTHRRFVFVVIAILAATIATARKRPVLTVFLWCPIFLIYMASLLGRAPFGGGRTDIFLYPLIAVLAALGTGEMLRLNKEMWHGKKWQRYLGPVAAVAICILIVRGARAAFPNHAEEDLRPLARHLMEEKKKGDVIVVYPAARYEWFLYSNEPFSIVPREKHPVAFPYTMEAADTIVLDEYPENSSTYASELDRVVGAKRIWLVASHLIFNHSFDTDKIEARLRNKGYRLRSKERRAGAFIELWVGSN